MSSQVWNTCGSGAAIGLEIRTYRGFSRCLLARSPNCARVDRWMAPSCTPLCSFIPLGQQLMCTSIYLRSAKSKNRNLVSWHKGLEIITGDYLAGGRHDRVVLVAVLVVRPTVATVMLPVTSLSMWCVASLQYMAGAPVADNDDWRLPRRMQQN